MFQSCQINNTLCIVAESVAALCGMLSLVYVNLGNLIKSHMNNLTLDPPNCSQAIITNMHQTKHKYKYSPMLKWRENNCLETFLKK